MSTPILPFAVWAPGTNQNSIPANDNSLRNQILNGLIISESTDAQPGSPSDGDIYIMTGAASGSQWAAFDQYDLAIYDSGTWYAFAPVEGIVVNIAGTLKQFSGSSGYTNVGVTASSDVTIVTEASTSTMDPATHSGLDKYIRAADDVTFNTSEGYSAGEVYNIRATAALTLIGTGVTLTPPFGGSLNLSEDMAVTVVMTSSSAGDVIGQTDASS